MAQLFDSKGGAWAQDPMTPKAWKWVQLWFGRRPPFPYLILEKAWAEPPGQRANPQGAAIRRILMPLVRVTMIKGKSPDYIKKMSDSIYEALVEAYVQQKEETFQIIEQLEPSDLIYARRFGIQGSRSENFVIINIESDARRRAEKEALLSRLSDKLAASPGIARDDVMVRLSMTSGLDDWSLGSGIAVSKS